MSDIMEAVFHVIPPNTVINVTAIDSLLQIFITGSLLLI